MSVAGLRLSRRLVLHRHPQNFVGPLDLRQAFCRGGIGRIELERLLEERLGRAVRPLGERLAAQIRQLVGDRRLIGAESASAGKSAPPSSSNPAPLHGRAVRDMFDAPPAENVGRHRNRLRRSTLSQVQVTSKPHCDTSQWSTEMSGSGCKTLIERASQTAQGSIALRLHYATRISGGQTNPLAVSRNASPTGPIARTPRSSQAVDDRKPRRCVVNHDSFDSATVRILENL